METPREFDLRYSFLIHPAAPGTHQMLARDQASHKVFLKKHDPSLDIDIATMKKKASILNPGIQVHLNVAIGDKDYMLIADNMNAETILSPSAELPNTAKKVVNKVGDILSLGGAFDISKYEDTAHLQGVPLRGFQFSAVSGKAMQMQNNVDGVFGVVRERELTGGPETLAENVMSRFKVVLPNRPLAEDINRGSSEHICNLTQDISGLSNKINLAPVVNRPNQYLYTDEMLFESGITYGSEKILDKGLGCYDPLKTFLSLPTDSFEKYKKATGAVVDDATGLLVITEEQYKKLATLKVRVGEAIHDLIPNAQIWPRQLNDLLGGVPGKIYLGIIDSGVPRGAPFDVVLGYIFYQRFMVVMDPVEEHKIGFGKTEYTNAELN